jgi:hypothetical protein
MDEVLGHPRRHTKKISVLQREATAREAPLDRAVVGKTEIAKQPS